MRKSMEERDGYRGGPGGGGVARNGIILSSSLAGGEVSRSVGDRCRWWWEGGAQSQSHHRVLEIMWKLNREEETKRAEKTSNNKWNMSNENQYELVWNRFVFGFFVPVLPIRFLFSTSICLSRLFLVSMLCTGWRDGWLAVLWFARSWLCKLVFILCRIVLQSAPQYIAHRSHSI